MRGFAALGICGFVVAFSIATTFRFMDQTYRRAAFEVCDLVDANYYRRDHPAVQDFLRRCRNGAHEQSFHILRSFNVQRINSRLSELDVSHLFVYSPEESRLLWENQGLETGLRARRIEDQVIVYKVLADGPGARAGLRPGDVLLTLNGNTVFSPFDAQTGEGVFVVKRKQERFKVQIIAEPLKEDLGPTLRSLKGADSTGVLALPSFLPEYFEDSSWRNLVGHLSTYSHLIIDLRGNIGGSYPAMLRALAPFRCGREAVGEIFRSPHQGDLGAERDLVSGQGQLSNDLDTAGQLDLLHRYPVVMLKVPSGYNCFDRPVTLLVDGGTSSVAEIFAHAFHDRPKSLVWGQPTSGQVVMARWFEIEALGRGGAYSLSIPIAGYRTSDGIELESHGVQPDKLLHYDLGQAERGLDSWLEEVRLSLSTFSRVSSESL